MSTKENIIIAFWNLYQDKEINKITIKELMDKAGYHRSVFYVHFKDIYDLLEQEKTKMLKELNMFIPYMLNDFFYDKYDLNTLRKARYFYNTYSSKVYILLGEHGDMNFQHRVKEEIKRNMYKFLKLDKENNRLRLAIEFFLNGHINTILYVYRNKNGLTIEDYLEIIKPIINLIIKIDNKRIFVD